MTDLHQAPTMPVAHKVHRCIRCYAAIPVGERYMQQEGFFDGRAYRDRFHNECWQSMCDQYDGDFEFVPGEGEPPERLTTKEQA